MPVTMRDVADRAGVSPTVVSCVLGGKTAAFRVSEATAARVQEAARELGYRINIVARQLRQRATMQIGVLHGIGFGRHRFIGYFAELMNGIVDGAFENGYALTLCPNLLGQSPEDAMSDGRFDGLVWYSTMPSEENRAMLERCSVPLVLIHTPAETFGHRFPTVICDNDQGIGLAIDHLADLGHTNVAFAYNSSDAFGEVGLRLAAFVRHAARRGFENPEDVVLVNDANGASDYFKKGLRHTAIVAASDSVAQGFIDIAPSFGISIPEDLSVVGFDSTIFCEITRPSLTSVYQPLVQMGHSAVDLLVKRIREGESATSTLVLPCGFDVRNSTTSLKPR